MSTFQGLEMAKKALFVQQSALYTTGHNISNANTEGYSRQRVNFVADTPFPAPAANRPGIPGQIGTGVKAGSVQRIRDEFLDLQFRNENTRVGYWEKRADALNRMENVMNELNETGLTQSINQFWESLQDLSVSPSNQGARSVVVERAKAMAETFKYYDDSLTQIQNDLKVELQTLVDNPSSEHENGVINDLIDGIKDLNEQIESLEIHGYVTNDLYDNRDRLIDQLSSIIEIDINYTDSSSYAKKEAQGVATVTIPNGGNPIKLVNGVTGEVNHVSIPTIREENLDPITELVIKNADGELVGTIDEFPQQNGSIFALIEMYGYAGDEEAQAVNYNRMKTDLKDIQAVLQDAFNEVHSEGFGIEGETGNDFFELTAEGLLQVRLEIVANPNLIAAASADNFQPNDDGLGDGSNAAALASVFDDKGLTFGNGTTSSITDRYKSVIGSLAVQVEESNRMAENTGVLLAQVSNNRDSVSSVSLDEEMTNMIKFQHAYNAAARSMTATDELLDRVINNMGLVGR